MNNGMIGKYVLVRCRDAGVHCGILTGNEGREVVLNEARRLWYWKPARGAFLSAVSELGLHKTSKIGRPQAVLHLTETCEIALCSDEAESSIRAHPNSHE